MTHKEMGKILKALANRRRLGIIEFLRKNKTASVSEIAREIKLSRRSTSRHLAALRNVELVAYEQSGLTINYWLAENSLRAVKEILTFFKV